MTRVVGTPLRVTEFGSPSDEAISARISGDTVPRIRIDAGGRITWGDGSAFGDVKLYRAATGAIVTDGFFFASGGLQTAVVAASPNSIVPDGSILVDSGSDSLYFRSNDQWISSGAQYLDGLVDVVTSSVSVGDALKWDGTNWINGPVSVIATLNDLTDVSINSVDDGQILKYSSASMIWYNEYEAIQNVDGGLANSVYGGIVALSGGGANG